MFNIAWAGKGHIDSVLWKLTHHCPKKKKLLICICLLQISHNVVLYKFVYFLLRNECNRSFT